MKLEDIKRQRLFLDGELLFLSQAKEDGLLNEKEYQSKFNLCSSRADQLSEEMKKHNEWANHDTVVTFQHKEDNYKADRIGKIAWPNVQWDSENGQGFAYCNAIDVPSLIEWLNKNKCSQVAYRAK